MKQGKRILDEKFFSLGNSDWATEESWGVVTVPQAKTPWILVAIGLVGIIGVAHAIRARKK